MKWEQGEAELAGLGGGTALEGNQKKEDTEDKMWLVSPELPPEWGYVGAQEMLIWESSVLEELTERHQTVLDTVRQ